MNKHLKAAVASSALLLSGAVCASDFDPKFYVGAEAGINRLTLKESGDSSKSTKPSLGALLGIRFVEYAGLELGYTTFGTFKYKDTITSDKHKVKIPHLDILGYLPVSSDFDLIGALGMGKFSDKSKETEISTGGVTDSKIKANALRIGFGLQYKFDENFSAKLMLRHQNLRSLKVDGAKVDGLKGSLNSAVLGLSYQF